MACAVAANAPSGSLGGARPMTSGIELALSCREVAVFEYPGEPNGPYNKLQGAPVCVTTRVFFCSFIFLVWLPPVYREYGANYGCPVLLHH